MTEKVMVNRDMIDSFLELEYKTNIGMKPSKNLIKNMLKLVNGTGQALGREKITSDPYYNKIEHKHVSYESVRNKIKPSPVRKSTKGIIYNSQVEEFQREKKRQRKSKNLRVDISLDNLHPEVMTKKCVFRRGMLILS